MFIFSIDLEIFSKYPNDFESDNMTKLVILHGQSYLYILYVLKLQIDIASNILAKTIREHYTLLCVYSYCIISRANIAQYANSSAQVFEKVYHCNIMYTNLSHIVICLHQYPAAFFHDILFEHLIPVENFREASRNIGRGNFPMT